LVIVSVFDPPPPRDCVDGVPVDLDALCCELLKRKPEERPLGRPDVVGPPSRECVPERAESAAVEWPDEVVGDE